MLVYVLNKHGEPLMPCSPRKARITTLLTMELGAIKLSQFLPNLKDKVSLRE